MRIINDFHCGVTRKTGTTAQSAHALNMHTLSTLHDLVQTDDTVVILGDLFDKACVDYSTLLKVWSILSEAPCSRIVLVRGNHDIVRDTSKVSACDVLGSLLVQHNRGDYIVEPMRQGDLVFIPHMPNQELFDAAIAEYAGKNRILLTHANYENPFADNQDHSLNLTREQASKYKLVILGHEHRRRRVDNVVIIGSQTITRMDDIVPVKSYIEFGDDYSIEEVIVARQEDVFEEVDWCNLASDKQFIKVTGKAKASETGDVLTEISKFRKESDAFIIQNSVEVEQAGRLADAERTLESVMNFNAVKMLRQMLNKEQLALLDRILEDAA